MAEKKEAGRGKKTCPGCGKIIGARTQECECGYKFEPKTKKATAGGGLDLAGFISVLEKVKTGFDNFKTWEEARAEVEKVFDLAEAVGGEAALLEILTYLENQE